MDDIPNILTIFDKDDFDNISHEQWRSKFHNGTLVIYHDDIYIRIEVACAIAQTGNNVKLNDMSKF